MVQIHLYHSCNLSPAIVLKQGLHPHMNGEAVNDKQVIFTTPILSYSQNYGKYTYVIVKDVSAKVAAQVSELLAKIEAGEETTENDNDILEMCYESIDANEISVM